jgi:hypothetical protein
MRNFFWPTDLESEQTVGVRIGRAVQWLSVVALAFTAFYFLLLAIRLTDEDFYPVGKMVLFPLWLVAMSACWGVGRLGRYIIAGE